MQKIRLLLSFDHELSLGGTESYRHNLFDPTETLFAVADELSVPITLFTDILCGLRYREWDYEGFYVPYCRQLHSALARDHDVQLHVHPHWVNSTFSGGVFRPSTSFSLESFSDTPPPNDVASIIARAFSSLVEICRAREPRYACIAYRAGGFNLAPEDQVLTVLHRHGIRIDSSVIKGYRFKSEISEVDYSRTPSPANWTVWPPGIFEVPIASKPRTPLNNLPFLTSRVLHRKRAHDPRGSAIHAQHTQPLQKLGRLFPRSAWTLGFDDAAQSVDDVMKILHAHVAAHSRDREIICAALSHPKNMGEYEFALMRAFVRRARREFGNALIFDTFAGVYRDVLPRPLPVPGRPFALA